MFLIERLPKESEKLPLAQPTDKLSLIEQDIARSIGVQLNASWIPQYCKKSGITKLSNVVVVQNNPFLPQNLHIPFVSMHFHVDIMLVFTLRCVHFQGK